MRCDLATAAGCAKGAQFERSLGDGTVSPGRHCLSSNAGNRQPVCAIASPIVEADVHEWTFTVTSSSGHLVVGVTDASRPLTLHNAGRGWGVYPASRVLVKTENATRIAPPSKGGSIAHGAEPAGFVWDVRINVDMTERTAQFHVNGAQVAQAKGLAESIRPWVWMFWEGDSVAISTHHVASTDPLLIPETASGRDVLCDELGC